MSKRYYWLKLDKDFFNRPDIKIIEAQADGVLYSYFYLKLLLQSVESQGVLKYNNIPFDVEMLSKITGTSPSVVKSAIDIFLKMNMLQILEDGSLFISEVALLLGSETEDARRKREKKKEIKLIENKEIKEEKKKPMTVAERVKKYREKKKLENKIENSVTNSNVTCNENNAKNISAFSSKDIDIKGKNSVTEIFCNDNNNVTKCNVTCNENSNEDVTNFSLKIIENKREKDVTENFQKISLYQDIDKDIYTCHEENKKRKDKDIEKIFHELKINYTDANEKYSLKILEELDGDKKLLKNYLENIYREISNIPKIKNIAALFSAKIREINYSLVEKIKNKDKTKTKEIEEIKKKEEEVKAIIEEHLTKKQTIEHFLTLDRELQKEIVKKSEENYLKTHPDDKGLEIFKTTSYNLYLQVIYKELIEVIRKDYSELLENRLIYEYSQNYFFSKGD
jgi:phage replisome organizer N-terminal domain protein